MELLADLLPLLERSKYALIFIACYLEGPGVMLTTGVLWSLGTVAFWPAFTALFLGDILSDIMWYTLGRHAGRPFITRFGPWFGVVPETIEKSQHLFHRYHTSVLGISKLTMGFGLAIPLIMVAGMLHIPFKRFLIINSLGALILLPTMMVFGYYSGNAITGVPDEWQLYLVAGAVVCCFGLFRVLGQRLSRIAW